MMGFLTQNGKHAQRKKHALHKAEDRKEVDKENQKMIHAVLNTRSPFVIKEAYKSLRTNIMFSLSTVEGCKKIAVTSPNSGEGKTTTCLNLAMTFAMTGAKVIIIDADMRKPRIHRCLGLDKKNGLSNILSGFEKKEDSINKDVRSGLDCITSGLIPPNPAELLSSDAMTRLLDELSQEYDYIFIDTPPVTIVTDAAAISKMVSGIIVVIRPNVTLHESVARTVSSLGFANAKILGFIMNDVKLSDTGYGGYKNKYAYKYKYKDSYTYGEKEEIL